MIPKLLFKNGKFYKPVIDSYSECICHRCALDGELCKSEETGVAECNVYASPDVCFIEYKTLTTKDIKDVCYHFLPSICSHQFRRNEYVCSRITQ